MALKMRQIEPKPFYSSPAPLRRYPVESHAHLSEADLLTKREKVKNKILYGNQLGDGRVSSNYRDSLEVDSDGVAHDPEYLAHIKASTSAPARRKPSSASSISASSDEEDDRPIPALRNGTAPKRTSMSSMRSNTSRTAMTTNAGAYSRLPQTPRLNNGFPNSANLQSSMLSPRGPPSIRSVSAGSALDSKRHSVSSSRPLASSAVSHTPSRRTYPPSSLHSLRIPEDSDQVTLSTATSSKYNPYSYSPAMAVTSYRMSSAPSNALSAVPTGATRHATIRPDGSPLVAEVKAAENLSSSAKGAQADIWQEARVQESTNPRFQIDSDYIPSLDNPAEHQFNRAGNKTLGDSLHEGWAKTKLDLRLAVFRSSKKLRG